MPQNRARTIKLRKDAVLNFGFVLAIVSLIMVGIYLQKKISYINDVTNLRADARNVAFRIHGIENLIVLSETGQRGYLLTGNKEYLNSYHHAAENIPKEIADISEKLSEYPEQVERLSLLKQLSDEKILELEKTIRLKEAGKTAEAVAIVSTNFGLQRMDQIHELIEELSSGQQELVKHRNNQVLDIIVRSADAVFWANTIAVFMTAGFLFMLNRVHRRRISVQRTLRATNAELLEHQSLQEKIIDMQNQIGSSELNSMSMMNMVVKQSALLTRADGAIIEVVDGDDLVYHHTYGAADKYINMRIPIPGSFSGLSLKTNEALICSDSENDFRVNVEACRKINVRSMIVIPLRHGAHTIGILKNYSSQPHHFSKKSLDALSLIINVFSSALGRAIEFEEKTELIKVLKATEIELIKSRDIAENATKAKSLFFASMSHEFRTPLNGILGMTNLLAEEPLNPSQKSYATSIRRSGELLLRIINDALDFSKIEAGKLELEQVNFNLVELVEDLRRSFVQTAQKKDVSLEIEIDKDLPEKFSGDPGRLQQVLMNLVGNAFKFTSSGYVKVKVHKKSHVGDKYDLYFEVEDTGIGLSEESQKKIFQEFSQADASTTRKYGGTGLGLVICKRLVELMQGAIGVRSKPENGSVFWFQIRVGEPVQIDETTAAKANEAKKNIVFNRVLVVEDNQVNQIIVSKMLEKLAIKHDVVENGQEAVNALQNSAYDLVLMDCNMPVMDGYEATKFIRTSGSIPNNYVPIVAMTANAMKTDFEVCINAGMDDYLTKPLNVDQLIGILSKYSA